MATSLLLTLILEAPSIHCRYYSANFPCSFWINKIETMEIEKENRGKGGESLSWVRVEWFMRAGAGSGRVITVSIPIIGISVLDLCVRMGYYNIIHHITILPPLPLFPPTFGLNWQEWGRYPIWYLFWPGHTQANQAKLGPIYLMA